MKIYFLFNSGENIINEINNWVSKNTNGKIKKILDENSELLPIIAVNVIYFYDEWIHEFINEGKMDFYTTENDIVNTDFMSLTLFLKFIFKNDYKAIEIPYKNKRYSMFIIVPENWGHVPDNLQSIINEVEKSKGGLVRLYLPKFEIDKTYHDLTKYLDIPNELKEYLEINQKTYVKVDEKGTEAITVTWGGLRGGGGISINITEFMVDKPFIFVLYDKEKDLVLFIGYIYNPSNRMSTRQNTTSLY